MSGGIYKQKNICTYKDDDSHYTCNKNIESKYINGLNILPVWSRDNYRMRNFNLRAESTMSCSRYFRITTSTHDAMFEILQDHDIYACYVWDTSGSLHLRMLCLRYFMITTSTHDVMFEILQDHDIYECYVWDTLGSRHLRIMWGFKVQASFMQYSKLQLLQLRLISSPEVVGSSNNSRLSRIVP